MTSVRSTPSPTSHTIVPPIITNERDREFLIDLNSHIDSELAKINKTVPEERYTVYKGAFDQIIDYVTAYKPLLTAIKAEYEECIDTIVRGQREAFFLGGKLKAMAHEPSTIHNYRKRAEDLQQKVSIIDSDNEKLRQQLTELRNAREEREKKAKEIAEPPRHATKKDRRPIPGLTLQQSTDIKVLRKELEKLERQIKELSNSHRTRYTSKQIKDSLKDTLSDKVAHRDQLAENSEILKLKRQKLKVAVEAAQAYLRIQPPHQTIGDAVVMALARANTQTNMDKGDEGVARGTPSTTFEDDDPTKEKEAEMMLEYIEKFNELMEDNRYEAAAIHAANSPKGILRTPETLARFKELHGQVTGSGRSCLLAFCDALMSTVLAFGVRPSEYMSMECVMCALNENRLDLLQHWISQDRLTVSEDLGQLIYNYCASRGGSGGHSPTVVLSGELRSGLALAQRVFMQCRGCTAPAMVCMVRQGRVTQALEYAQEHRASLNEYVQLLSECPLPHLAQALYQTRVPSPRGPQTPGRPLLPLGVIVTTLIECGQEGVGLHLIHDIHAHGGSQASSSDAGPLTDAVFADDITPEAQWVDIVQRLQDNGYNEAVVDILAAITVQGAVKSARSITQQLQHGDAEEQEQGNVENEQEMSIGGGEEEEESGIPQRNSDREQENLDEGLVMDANHS